MIDLNFFGKFGGCEAKAREWNFEAGEHKRQMSPEEGENEASLSLPCGRQKCQVSKVAFSKH